MLSKKDKNEIREVIREELKDALFRKITIERGPRKPGDKEKHISADEEWNILDFYAAYIPKIEAALRGMQEDTNKANNKMIASNEGVAAIANILCSYEDSIKSLALFVNQSAQLESNNKFIGEV